MKKVIGNINLINKSILLLLVMSLLNITSSLAQEEYSSSAGILKVKASIEGDQVNISSKDLLILLDYESGQVLMKQKTASLISDNDSLQAKLDHFEDQYISFEGKLGLDYINTTGHPPQNFDIEGVLYPVNKHILGTGMLIHRVQGTSSACILTLSFKLDLNELFPGYHITGMQDEVNVYVVQSVLARVSD